MDSETGPSVLDNGVVPVGENRRNSKTCCDRWPFSLATGTQMQYRATPFGGQRVRRPPKGLRRLPAPEIGPLPFGTTDFLDSTDHSGG